MSYKGYQWLVASRHVLASSKIIITPLNAPTGVLIDLFFIKKSRIQTITSSTFNDILRTRNNS